MKKLICALSMLTILSFLGSCEEMLSKSFDNEDLKKLRAENTNLRIQVDKLKRQINEYEKDTETKNLIISIYDLRHAVEKYAQSHKGEYPAAENINELTEIVKQYLPKGFSLDSEFFETIKSSSKGYIFIANINSQKIVVSNLI